jgi:putative peptide zinc metalloprotease protein
VANQPPANELQRRKQVRLRLRPNLRITARPEEGQTVYVVGDPVTLSHFRLDERQRYAVGLMDGAHTLAEIQEACEAHFRPQRLPLEELEAFAAQPLGSGLAQSESPGAGRFLFGQWQKHRRETFRAALANFLYVKVPLCDPDPLLARLAPRLRFLFGLWGGLFALGLALAALALIATRWHDFVGRLPSYRDFFTVHTLVYLWLAVGLAKLLHELGHGLCCKVHGAAVHEAGALLLFFCPTLYCNVSDSWNLPGEWQRMAIAAAGIYVDLLVAAVATFVWWATDPAALLHHLCLGLMVVCGAGTLAWNANPLMRFDGYYVLSDWLGVPNLLERSSQFVGALFLRWLGIDVAAEPVQGRARRLFFAAYAVAGGAYRLAMTAAALCALYAFLEPYRLGVIGLALGAATAGALVGRPAWAALRSVWERGRLPEMRPARLWLLASAGLLVLGLFVTVPLPMRVDGRALFQADPDHDRRVVVPATGGFVREVLVRDGQAVRAGDVLAVLTNPQLEIKLRVNEADQALRSQQLSGQVAFLAAAGPGDDLPGAAVPQTELELNALVREHALLREQRAGLTLRAPCAGAVMGLDAERLKGKWLEQGTEVCHVAEPGALRAVLLIDPADHNLVRPGSPAWVRVHGRGACSWPGAVTEVAQVDAKRIPPQLSSHAGGEVVTEHDPVSGAEKPRNPRYLVAVRLQEAEAIAPPGTLGRLKIEAAAQTGWWRLRRYLAAAFGWGL